MNELKKRCFVIGPMTDMDRLDKLAYEVIKPIVEPYGFDVITPLEGVDGHIMHHVLLELERADLLIADLSGNNPNVMYELGIYHSFGKAYLALKDDNLTSDKEKTPFDIQSYRFQNINLNDVSNSITILKPKILNLVKRIDFEDYFNNPVTDFYQSPVTEIPTAVGLAKNYEKNFLNQIIPLVFKKNERDENFMVEIKEDVEEQKIGRVLSDKERNILKVRILIPSELEYATHENITHFKEDGVIKSNNWVINRKTRPFGISMIFEDDYCPVIIDIPSVLSTLEESIKNRRNIRELQQISKRDWEELKKKELERFAGKCLRYKENLAIRYKNRVEIITNWDPYKVSK
ncbi:MAG: STING domain-containing protein [Draconibacterium sp.]